jgi:hypothetical protein
MSKTAVIYIVYFLAVIIFSFILLYIFKKNLIKKINFMEIVIFSNGITLFFYFLYWAFTAKKYFYKHIGPASCVILILYFVSAISEEIKRKGYFKSKNTVSLDKSKNRNNKSIKHNINKNNTST